MKDLQPKSHPLKWAFLKYEIEGSGLENPDIYIEDIRECGPCIGVVPVRYNEGLTYPGGETQAIEASFSLLVDKENNRIVICHHF